MKHNGKEVEASTLSCVELKNKLSKASFKEKIRLVKEAGFELVNEVSGEFRRGVDNIVLTPRNQAERRVLKRSSLTPKPRIYDHGCVGGDGLTTPSQTQ